VIYHWYIKDISIKNVIYHWKNNCMIYSISNWYKSAISVKYLDTKIILHWYITMICQYQQLIKVYHQLWYNIRMVIYHEFIRTIHHITLRRRYRHKISWYIKNTDVMQWYITKVIWYLAIYRRYIAKIS